MASWAPSWKPQKTREHPSATISCYSLPCILVIRIDTIFETFQMIPSLQATIIIVMSFGQLFFVTRAYLSMADADHVSHAENRVSVTGVWLLGQVKCFATKAAWKDVIRTSKCLPYRDHHHRTFNKASVACELKGSTRNVWNKRGRF